MYFPFPSNITQLVIHVDIQPDKGTKFNVMNKKTYCVIQTLQKKCLCV